MSDLNLKKKPKKQTIQSYFEDLLFKEKKLKKIIISQMKQKMLLKLKHKAYDDQLRNMREYFINSSEDIITVKTLTKTEK